jgi:hypothetical protein
MPRLSIRRTTVSNSDAVMSAIGRAPSHGKTSRSKCWKMRPPWFVAHLMEYLATSNRYLSRNHLPSVGESKIEPALIEQLGGFCARLGITDGDIGQRHGVTPFRRQFACPQCCRRGIIGQYHYPQDFNPAIKQVVTRILGSYWLYWNTKKWWRLGEPTMVAIHAVL